MNKGAGFISSFLWDVALAAMAASIIFGVAALLGGCGSPGTEKGLFGDQLCVPNTTQECVCPGGIVGAQACRDDGKGYTACQCMVGDAGASGAGGAGGGGSAGAAGAGGGCTPRTTCPAPEGDGGAAICGALDDYCGGKITCGCDFGSCTSGLCTCGRMTAQYDAACSAFGAPPIAIQCSIGVSAPSGCRHSPVGQGFPDATYCCAL
jgi:hypothetical protein